MSHFSAVLLQRWQLALTGLAVVAGAFLLYTTFSSPPSTPEPSALLLQSNIAANPPTQFEEQASRSGAVHDTIVVYVSGAVQNPDVYTLPAQARVKDVILAAGGFSTDADPERINLAQRLKDEDHIQVPHQSEAGASDSVGDAPLSADAEGPININTANTTELESLPGVGTALADRIIEYRLTEGPFQSIEALQDIKGIGPALFQKIAPLITVGP